MKKTVKRLALHRETLHYLGELSRVVGGSEETSVLYKTPSHCDCASEGGGCTLPATAAFGTCASC